MRNIKKEVPTMKRLAKEGMTKAEIARRLGISHTTVGKYLGAARKSPNYIMETDIPTIVDLVAEGHSIGAIAEMFDVSRTTIRKYHAIGLEKAKEKKVETPYTPAPTPIAPPVLNVPEEIRKLKDMIALLEASIKETKGYWTPKIGELCYTPHMGINSMYTKGIWRDSTEEKRFRDTGLICKTPEEAVEITLVLKEAVKNYREKKEGGK